MSDECLLGDLKYRKVRTKTACTIQSQGITRCTCLTKNKYQKQVMEVRLKVEHARPDKEINAWYWSIFSHNAFCRTSKSHVTNFCWWRAISNTPYQRSVTSSKANKIGKIDLATRFDPSVYRRLTKLRNLERDIHSIHYRRTTSNARVFSGK